MRFENESSDQWSEEDSSKSPVEINHLAQNLVDSFSSRLENYNIRVETDLPMVTADVFPTVIHRAVANLLENAIDSMPTGGELLVTLVDCRHQWELEIADTRSKHVQPRQSFVAESEPVRMQPMQNQRKLEVANSAAMIHGGQVQTWECPQGGTANVLVIPRFALRNAT